VRLPGPAGARPATARGRATRSALVTAARGVFERDGFVDARITDITAAAGAATGSFYGYFASKEEIFTAVIDELHEHEGLHPVSMTFLVDAVSDPEHLAPTIAAAHRAYLVSFAAHARLMSVMEQVTTISERFRRHRTRAAQAHVIANAHAVSQLQLTGHADAGLEPLQTARSLSTMVSRSAFIAFVLEEQGSAEIDGLAMSLARLWMNALRLT
jgi:AcrR family transcriptional regulator